jgi:nitronate monooxygenase
MSPTRPVLRTKLCELLGIEYPILQSGMRDVAGPDLVAAVSNAGGLGILAGLLLTADQLRQAIAAIRARTTHRFGVNLLLPADLRPPVPAAQIPETSVHAMQAALDPMRMDLGLSPVSTWPPTPPDLVPEALQTILDERVPVFSVGLGNPGAELVAECHQRGIRVLAMVTTVEEAQAVEAAGVDAVVAQGSEAGGHRAHFEKPRSADAGAIGTLALVPQVVDAVRIPVVAAGGIADGRGVAAALALGASGVLMGTRFVATHESMAPEAYKKALMESSADATAVTDIFSGRYARALKNGFMQRYASAAAPVLPFPWPYFAAADIYRAAAAQGNREYLPMWAGQSVGLVQNLPGVVEVVERLVEKTRAVLMQRLPAAARLE